MVERRTTAQVIARTSPAGRDSFGVMAAHAGKGGLSLGAAAWYADPPPSVSAAATTSPVDRRARFSDRVQTFTIPDARGDQDGGKGSTGGKGAPPPTHQSTRDPGFEELGYVGKGSEKGNAAGKGMSASPSTSAPTAALVGCASSAGAVNASSGTWAVDAADVAAAGATESHATSWHPAQGGMADPWAGSTDTRGTESIDEARLMAGWIGWWKRARGDRTASNLRIHVDKTIRYWGNWQNTVKTSNRRTEYKYWLPQDETAQVTP